MNSSIRQFNPRLIIIALTATIATVAQPQPASAQILEIVSGALGALVKSKQPQPQVIQQPVPVPVPVPPRRPEFNVGTNNANGNSLNLCLSSCLPAGSAPAPALLAPQPIVPQIPQVVQHSPIVQQSPVAQQQTSSTVVNHNGVVNGTATAQPNQQSSSASAIQNIPNYPTMNIPPANLPINLPR